MKKIILIITVMILVYTFAFTAELKTPKGFSWFKNEKFKGAILKPDGWVTDISEQVNLVGILIADSKFSENKEFKTGLSVIITKNLDKNATLDDIIAHQKSSITANFPDSKIKNVKRGKLKGFEVNYEFLARDMVYLLFLGNPETDEIFIISFKSPIFGYSDHWEKYGKIMTSKIILD